jgi:hypothetical protein
LCSTTRCGIYSAVDAAGAVARLLAGLEQAEPAARTDFAKPLKHFQQFLRRRGIVLVISDFYEEPETIVKTIEPLRFHGSEVVLFHMCWTRRRFSGDEGAGDSGGPGDGPAAGGDSGLREDQYRAKMDDHLEQMRRSTQAAGMGYHLLTTDKPLDRALTEYLSLRQARGDRARVALGGGVMGFLAPWFLAGCWRWGCRCLCICCGGRRRCRGR